MSPSDPIQASLASLSQFFVGGASLADTLHRVSELALEAVGGADMAGITLLVDGRPRTAVFTDPASPEIDSAQYETGIGPCLDAFRHGSIYRIDSTEDDERWPPFSQAAAAHGVRSTISFPLVVNGESMGALNFYSRSPAAFADGGSEAGQPFATQAAIVLANAQVYWDAKALNEGLTEAMRSRAVIEQAKGILMAAGGRTPDDAFGLLVRASQRENRKLRDIAAELVQRAQERPLTASPPTRTGPSRTPGGC